MKEISCYDWLKWDGGELHKHHAYIQLNEGELVHMQLKNPQDIFNKRIIVIYEDINDYGKNSVDLVRKKALEKLTEYEIHLLGLDK
jgi:predicted transcriptional regulator